MQNRLLKYVYRFSVFMLIITGFAQMPVFKRYYVADIPGFGWLAQFYTTHLLHYCFSILFLFCIFWYAALYIGEKKCMPPISRIIQAAVYGGLVVSGFILVVKNFPVYLFPENFIILTDLVHLGLVIVFFVFSAGVLVYNKIKQRREKLI